MGKIIQTARKTLYALIPIVLLPLSANYGSVPETLKHDDAQVKIFAEQLFSKPYTFTPFYEQPKEISPFEDYVDGLYRKLPWDNIESVLHKPYQKLGMQQYAPETRFLAMIGVESTGDPMAMNPIAKGWMGMTRIAWEEVDTSNYDTKWSDPEKNAEVGLKNYKKRFGEVVKFHPESNQLDNYALNNLASAARNGGFTRLRERNFDIADMPQETQNYVKKVMLLEERLNRRY